MYVGDSAAVTLAPDEVCLKVQGGLCKGYYWSADNVQYPAMRNTLNAEAQLIALAKQLQNELKRHQEQQETTVMLVMTLGPSRFVQVVIPHFTTQERTSVALRIMHRC